VVVALHTIGFKACTIISVEEGSAWPTSSFSKEGRRNKEKIMMEVQDISHHAVQRRSDQLRNVNAIRKSFAVIDGG
jgi:hypothetical protein